MIVESLARGSPTVERASRELAKHEVYLPALYTSSDLSFSRSFW
jgi:hypothetical protein